MIAYEKVYNLVPFEHRGSLLRLIERNNNSNTETFTIENTDQELFKDAKKLSQVKYTFKDQGQKFEDTILKIGYQDHNAVTVKFSDYLAKI